MEEFDQFDFEDVPVLHEVRMFAHPSLPNGICLIELSFSSGGLPGVKVFVAVDVDLDTLICSRSAPSFANECTSAFASCFWEPVLGRALTNAWRMTSDRGYPDAIQLRFREAASEGGYTIVQLYGEASQITLTELTVARRQSIKDGIGERPM